MQKRKRKKDRLFVAYMLMKRIQDTKECSFNAANRMEIGGNSCVSFSSDSFGCLRNSFLLVCVDFYII